MVHLSVALFSINRTSWPLALPPHLVIQSHQCVVYISRELKRRLATEKAENITGIITINGDKSENRA